MAEKKESIESGHGNLLSASWSLVASSDILSWFLRVSSWEKMSWYPFIHSLVWAWVLLSSIYSSRILISNFVISAFPPLIAASSSSARCVTIYPNLLSNAHLGLARFTVCVILLSPQFTCKTRSIDHSRLKLLFRSAPLTAISLLLMIEFHRWRSLCITQVHIKLTFGPFCRIRESSAFFHFAS